ncbi:MAG: hypothetical protein AAGC93_18230 [Cyanobacteria bacterium P01_F01_bin.53]
MKAVVFKQYDAPEVLKLQTVKKPVPGDREVLSKVHTTTVTAADFRVRSFTIPWVLWLPVRIVLSIRKPKNAILGAELGGSVPEQADYLISVKEFIEAGKIKLTIDRGYPL